MKKVLFVYGYGGSPQSTMCQLFRKYLPKNDYEIVSFVYPQHDCAQAVEFLEHKIEREDIDLVLGTSLGGFITLALNTKVPKYVVNPCMRPTVELPKLTPRPDHPDDVQPSPELIATYEPFENQLFAKSHKEEPITGFFAENDELVGTRYVEEFAIKFGRTVMIPGSHFGNKAGVQAVVEAITKLFQPTNAWGVQIPPEIGQTTVSDISNPF